MSFTPFDLILHEGVIRKLGLMFKKQHIAKELPKKLLLTHSCPVGGGVRVCAVAACSRTGSGSSICFEVRKTGSQP